MNSKKRIFSLGIALLTVISLDSSAHAEDTKIGVAVAAVINGSPGIGLEVSEALGAAIGAVLKAEVISGTEAQNLLPQSARSETCLGDTACLVAAGKALGVEQLLMLIIIDSAEEVKIEATWVDVAAGKTALRPAIRASKSSDSMAEQFAASAAGLLSGVELRAPIVDEPDPVDPDPVDPDPVDPIGSGSNPVTVKKSGGHHLSSTATILAYGGGVALVAGLGYGTFRYFTCGEGPGENADSGPGFGGRCGDKPAPEAIADVLAFGGLAALSGAAYLYFTSESESVAPLVLNVSDQSIGFSLGGRF